MPNVSKAIESFKNGLNCAQSVVLSYSEMLNIDKEMALGMACGFGAGMGRLQETCGAVTGSYMVLGVYNCSKFGDNKERKGRTYAMVQDFSNRFINIYGTTNCMKLLGCDLKTEEGQLFASENNLFETVCERCISDSVTILNDMLARQ